MRQLFGLRSALAEDTRATVVHTLVGDRDLVMDVGATP
jgi:hypothetical protein